MKAIYHWLRAGLLSGLLLLVVGSAMVYLLSERLLRRTYAEPRIDISVPSDSHSVLEGRRLALIRGCSGGCHGMQIEGWGVHCQTRIVGKNDVGLDVGVIVDVPAVGNVMPIPPDTITDRSSHKRYLKMAAMLPNSVVRSGCVGSSRIHNAQAGVDRGRYLGRDVPFDRQPHFDRSAAAPKRPLPRNYVAIVVEHLSNW